MRRKSKVVTIISIMIIIVLIVGGVFIYKDKTISKSVKKGTELLKEGEYNKALASYELALDDNKNNNEALKGKDMISSYLNAKKYFEDGKIEKAKETIDKIDDSYKDINTFKEDVDNLKSKINEYIEENKKITENISKVRDLINKKDFNKAKDLINDLEKDNLSSSNKETLKDLKGRVNSEINNEDKEKNSTKKKISYSNFKKPFMTEDEAEELINNELGNEKVSYGFLRSQGAQATMLYYFKEYQNTDYGVVKGQNYIVNGTTGEITTEDGESVMPAIR